MIKEIFQRTSLLIGEENLNLLSKKCVAVFGLGGVGGYALESIVRSGVGKVVIVDNDIINLTNINRQLFALNSTLGMLKTEAAALRLKDINNDLIIEKHNIFFDETTKNEIDFLLIDYIIDCIDSVKSKVLLAKLAKEYNIKIISSLGTGNKLDNKKFEICDIFETKICPLARVMRHELKKENITNLKVVYSKETPIISGAKVIPSISFVPPTAGLILAGEVIKDLLNK